MKASFNYQRLKFVAIVIALLHFSVWPQYIEGTLSLIAVSCVLFIVLLFCINCLYEFSDCHEASFMSRHNPGVRQYVSRTHPRKLTNYEVEELSNMWLSD